MREIILDTETTGLSHKNGDRIIEIGCLEIINLVPSGESFHHYLNPDRAISADAQAVHGISGDMLHDKPRFKNIMADFLAFIGDAPLVIHNASFDMGFIEAEMQAAGQQWNTQHKVVDTLSMARQKFPGAPASLDALCKRFQIDLSGREMHGALIDCQLLAAVYLELCGGRQTSLIDSDKSAGQDSKRTEAAASEADRRNNPLGNKSPHTAQKRPAPLASALTAEEEAAHKAFLEDLPQKAIWNLDSKD